MTTKCSDCGTFYDGRSCGSCARTLSHVPTADGGARFVGDATPIAGIPLSRIFNAACYIVAGIAGLAVSTQPGIPKVWTVLLGLAAIAYGIKIVITRNSYWVNTLVHLVAIFAVIATIGVLAN